jgi:hypothetical protein
MGRRRFGIVLSTHTADDGAAIFRHACPHGPRRNRIETAERALQVGAVAGLAQGEKPEQPGDDPGAGS